MKELQTAELTFIEKLRWNWNKLRWNLNPFKKEIVKILDISDVEKAAERFDKMYFKKALVIPKSKIEIQPLEWYFNAENVPNQKMLHTTFDYFYNGQQNPHQAIGMAYYFWTLFTQFQKHTLNWVQLTKCFDFSKEELHTLYGIILYWHGGYPTENRFTGQYLSALLILEREFLKFDGDTPEKEFCKRKTKVRDGKLQELDVRLDVINETWKDTDDNVDSPKIEPNRIKLLHFTRSLTSEEQTHLFIGLIDGGFIPKTSNKAHFNFIFGGTPISNDEKPFKPITWQKSVSLLAYCIDILFSDTDRKNLWEITSNCFLWKGSPPNTDTMKNTVSKYTNDYSEKPKGYEQIDKIATF